MFYLLQLELYILFQMDMLVQLESVRREMRKMEAKQKLQMLKMEAKQKLDGQKIASLVFKVSKMEVIMSSKSTYIIAKLMPRNYFIKVVSRNETKH